MKQEIRLGNLVTDVVTGITGTATQMIYKTNGCRQICIQPKGDGNTVPEAYCIDDFTIEYNGVGVADLIPAISDTNISIGQEVREIATRQVGVVVGKCIFLNGCINYEVHTKCVDNKAPEMFWCDQLKLEILNDGIKDKIIKTDTGGPMQRGACKSR